jgi:predicted aminopeptidase
MRSLGRHFAFVAWGILASVAMSGCSTVGYYSQAMAGQAEIMRKARPIAEAVRDDRVPDKTKRKLAVVQEARAFARDHLGLPAHRSYDRYTDLGRRHVSWVVFAAPEFSVEAKEWWYPVVGSLEYRGYFEESAARKEGALWQARGYDVYVGGVDAYSTLGWFHDPILNTSLRRPDTEIAELIFHELSHVKLFLPGDTDFNEAFATATAEEGVHRWLRARRDKGARAKYESALSKDREIVRLLLMTRGKLDRLYHDASLSLDEKRRRKAAVFQRMRTDYAIIRKRWRGDSRYDRAFAKPWNNARLNTVATYYDLVPGFQRLLRREGGDLEKFFAAVARMRAMTKEDRRELLRR